MTEEQETAFYAGVVSAMSVPYGKTGFRLRVDTPRHLVEDLGNWLDCHVNFRSKTRVAVQTGWFFSKPRDYKRWNAMMELVT